MWVCVTMVCMCVCVCVCCRTTKLGGSPLSDEERQSVLAAWQVEEQAYQSSHSRDFEGLTSGTRAVHKRIVRTVGEVRHCRWVKSGQGVLSLQCVFVFCQSPMVEPTFEDDDPDNWPSRRTALLCFAGAARKVCRVLECVVCVGGRGTSSVDGVGCMSWWTVTSLCSTMCVCVCMCMCVCVHVCRCCSKRMPPGCQHIWTVMDYLGLGCYSKRETLLQVGVESTLSV